MNDYTVEAVRRAARVLDALMFQPGQTLQEISSAVQLSKSTTFRLLFTLLQDELVAQHEDTKRYRLGPKMISLGQSAVNSTNIPDIARPVMAEVYEKFNVVLTLNTPSRDAVFEVLRVPQFGRGEFIPAGTPLPYHACASGHVLLAFSDGSLLEHVGEGSLHQRASQTPATVADLEAAVAQVRQQGYAVVRDTLEEGVTAVAAPVRGHRGDVVAALGSAAPSGALSEAEWQGLAEAVCAAGREISARIGYTPAAQG